MEDAEVLSKRPGCKEALPRRAAKERLQSKPVNATLVQQKVVNNTVTNSTSNTIMNAALNTHPHDIVQEITHLYRDDAMRTYQRQLSFLRAFNEKKMQHTPSERVQQHTVDMARKLLDAPSRLLNRVPYRVKLHRELQEG